MRRLYNNRLKDAKQFLKNRITERSLGLCSIYRNVRGYFRSVVTMLGGW